MKRDNCVVVYAPSKVNLYLQIHGTNDVGYHELTTVMQTTTLADVVTISKAEHGRITVSSTKKSIPSNEQNIAYKAAELFFATNSISHSGVDIFIEKITPDKAGLGGGSADAAAVLVGLNALYATELSQKQLSDMGAKIGADVPFCIVGGTALAEGIGDELTPLAPLSDCFLVIAKPQEGMSTPEAFARYDNYRGAFKQDNLEEFLDSLSKSNLLKMGDRLYNVFEEAIPSTVTELIRGIMMESGGLGAVLSGSGSAVVGLFKEKKFAENCMEKLKECYDDVFVVEPSPRGATIISLKNRLV